MTSLIVGALLAIGGVLILAVLAGKAVASSASARADAERARAAALAHTAAAALGPADDLMAVADAAFEPRRGCCPGCDAILDLLDAELAQLDTSLARLEADLMLAGRDLAGEVAGWLRDQTEGLYPPVIPGPEDGDRR